jgi:hypothetical protein
LRSEEIVEGESTNGKEPVSNGANIKNKQKVC